MDTGFKALPFKTENADVDLINYISEHGFKFFIDYHKPVKDPQLGSDFDRKYFTDYLRMFIFNDSIFNRDMAPDFTSTRENSIVDLISKSAPNVLYGIIGFLSEEEQVKFMESFLGTVILDMDMDRVTVNNLFLDKNIVKIIIKTNKLRSLIMFYSDRNEINDILFCLIGVKSGRENVYSALNEIFAKYIHTNAPHTLTAQEFSDIANIKRRLLGIAVAIIEIYNGGVTREKVAEFKLLTESTTDATPLNNMFWFIHNFLTISYHSIEKYSKVLQDFISSLDEKLEELEEMRENGNPAWENWNLPVEITNTRSQIVKLKGIRNDINSLKTENVIKLIRDFYCSDTIYWLSCQREIERQDMTDTVINNILDFVDFLNTPIVTPGAMCDPLAFQDYIMRAVNTDNKITASANIKGTLISILIRENTWHTTIKSKQEFIEQLVSVYIYINERQEEFEFAIDLHTIIGVFLADRDYCFTDYLASQGKREQIENLCHVFTDNIYNTQTRCFELLRIMNSRQNATGDYEGQEPETIDFTTDSQAIACNFMTIFGNSLERVIKVILRKHTEYMFGVATRDKFVMYLLYSISEMLGSNRSKLKVRDFNTFDATRCLVSLYELFTLSYPDSDFRKSVINETRFLDFGLLRKMGHILLNKKRAILNQEFINLSNQIHELEEAHKLLNDIDLDEVPDEFLDPIMGTLIDDPVMLPECETIMNRDIIYRHVLAERNNPFNRKELTISDLEAFNALEDTREKIVEFNSRKKQCLSELLNN